MKFLKRCKNEIRALCTDCAIEMIANRAKYKRPVSISMFMATLFSMMAMTFAANDVNTNEIIGLKDNIVTVISSIYSSVFVVVTVLAALLLIIAFIMRMTSNQQRAAQATQWIVRILICYVCINCVGVVFKLIESVSSGMRFQDKYANEYNALNTYRTGR